MALLLYVPQETQCTKDKLPLKLESAFPEEEGLLAAGALATPLDGVLAAVLGERRALELVTPDDCRREFAIRPSFARVRGAPSGCGGGSAPPPRAVGTQLSEFHFLGFRSFHPSNKRSGREPM